MLPLPPWFALAPLALAGAAEDRALIGQLDREVLALRQKVERLQGQLATCSTSSAPDPLYTELLQVLGGQPVAVSRRNRQTLVAVPLDNLYAPDGIALREEAWPVLDLVATALKLHPELVVTVVVHGDDATPPASVRKLLPTAWEWTSYRAATVAREMAEGFGVSPHRFTASGRADQEPIASNDTPEGRAQNRRVVFVLESRPTVDDPAPTSPAPSPGASP